MLGQCEIALRSEQPPLGTTSSQGPMAESQLRRLELASVLGMDLLWNVHGIGNFGCGWMVVQQCVRGTCLVTASVCVVGSLQQWHAPDRPVTFCPQKCVHVLTTPHV
ncbi:unnamed protein product [Polarella glacialis]|uniref:Uncharacterized protein n=1 Tax=Polarella glacialis TaxID=89957 RepID=A0A813F3I1_POLGL|nr:unnamed protein product [Polarella glacialis]